MRDKLSSGTATINIVHELVNTIDNMTESFGNVSFENPDDERDMAPDPVHHLTNETSALAEFDRLTGKENTDVTNAFEEIDKTVSISHISAHMDNPVEPDKLHWDEEDVADFQ